jgi:predicted DNA-binding transcriptional regulator YafY
VIVEVSSSKAHYFKAKKHLASQKIIEEKKDGTIVLCFTITQLKEIEEMILKWIPHMRVVSPLSLRESIEKKLKKYLESAYYLTNK